MSDLLTDPWFYATAIPAVALVGMSKGGFGGNLALIGVPLMALVMSPVRAAAIMLPILVVMDIVSLWAWRGHRDGATLKNMLPGAIAGIGLGWALASVVTAPAVRLVVGTLALLFVLRWVAQLLGYRPAHREQSPVAGNFWGGVSGFTSFVAHAGGPPYQIYALGLGQAPAVYVGTNVIFFAVVNAVKLVPYLALGQFDAANLTASLVLLPVAPVATLAGAYLVRRMKPEIFYPVMYCLLLLVSLKLIHDGLLLTE
jgi:uncharacterized membrane protein YfcA